MGKKKKNSAIKVIYAALNATKIENCKKLHSQFLSHAQNVTDNF